MEDGSEDSVELGVEDLAVECSGGVEELEGELEVKDPWGVELSSPLGTWLHGELMLELLLEPLTP
jgi:hypothetical protein